MNLNQKLTVAFRPDNASFLALVLRTARILLAGPETFRASLRDLLARFGLRSTRQLENTMALLVQQGGVERTEPGTGRAGAPSYRVAKDRLREISEGLALALPECTGTSTCTIGERVPEYSTNSTSTPIRSVLPVAPDPGDIEEKDRTFALLSKVGYLDGSERHRAWFHAMAAAARARGRRVDRLLRWLVVRAEQVIATACLPKGAGRGLSYRDEDLGRAVEKRSREVGWQARMVVDDLVARFSVDSSPAVVQNWWAQQQARRKAAATWRTA